jgi:class 3 adenylate cyclase
MTQATVKLAVLSADISGSTALYENLGDDLACRHASRPSPVPVRS